MLPTNYDISSVQPTVAASEEISDFGHQREDTEEPHSYQGVQKVKDKPIYIGQIPDNDATKSDRLIYLGKFDKDVHAARAHDLVALKLGAKTNFPENQYKGAVEAMTDMTQTEVVDTVRRLSFTFFKSISTYRGVYSRDLHTGKWEASFGKGSDDVRFLGIFDTEDAAARAFDVESVRLKGHNAITNFNIKFYNVDAILRGETNENVIYQSKGTGAVEAMPSFEEVLQNIIANGTSKIPDDTSNVKREGEQELQRPITGNAEGQENVAMACESSEDDGQGSSACWCFQHGRTDAC
ncbi:AP2-like ethylene-responsive transcription factor PLT2 [Cajanus cajan]|uniref:AP2-like ethylene-responsive transcription factor PLT2 n=1 Tax=Cajanus cajan TaxID=3821 RepID=UPI00098DBA34|nr:AP2-like ethylene-responsive transcription factor PLT2 [Cajanus cajan]